MRKVANSVSKTAWRRASQVARALASKCGKGRKKPPALGLREDGIKQAGPGCRLEGPKERNSTRYASALARRGRNIEFQEAPDIAAWVCQMSWLAAVSAERRGRPFAIGDIAWVDAVVQARFGSGAPFSARH